MNFIKTVGRLQFYISGSCVHLSPHGVRKGSVLISYLTHPFIKTSKSDGHTNAWEVREIAHTFLERGYEVDIIDWTNNRFIPRKPYAFFIDIHSNLERLASIINSDCIKIFHATGKHWLFQNHAEYQRLIDIQKRRGVTLFPKRIVTPSRSVDCADIISLLGNEETRKTYQHTNKEIWHIPLSTTHEFPSPAHKDFDMCKTKFIWFGGSGAVHKGLDRTLEAFHDMPEVTLSVYGKYKDDDFVRAYHRELFETQNIHAYGFLDPGSAEFERMRNEHIGLVYPSSSEGCAGSVVVMLHAGLIPIISKESGVDTKQFGITLMTCAIEEIKIAVRALSQEPMSQLKERSYAAWRYAREHHTKKLFSAQYQLFVDYLEKMRER